MGGRLWLLLEVGKVPWGWRVDGYWFIVGKGTQGKIKDTFAGKPQIQYKSLH